MFKDRTWMYNQLTNGYINAKFILGVKTFLDFAFSQSAYVSENKIRCPCSKYCNQKWGTHDEMRI